MPRPFIWTSPHHPKMLLFKFGWNWPSRSREYFFFISSMYFRYFVSISPWKRVGPSFHQTWVFITQECFVPSLVEISPVLLEKNIFKFRQCIWAIIYLSPLEIFFHPRMLCAIGLMENDDNDTDNGQKLIRKA